MKIGFQTLQSGDSENDSVWTEFTRRRVSGHLSAVCRQRPLLLAPTASTSRHATSGRPRRDLHSLRALHFAPQLPLRNLRRASASSPGRFTTSPAKLVRPELRLDILYLSVHFFPLVAALPTPSRAPPRRSSQRSPATWPDLSGSPLAVILLPLASP